jgi:hypothetical protein
MYSTSPDFDTAAIATIRQPKARITITWADPYIDTGVSVNPNIENNISDSLHVADTILETNKLWFLLDGNSKLDNSYKLFPIPHQSNYEVGWYGNEFSDGSGEFIIDPEIVVEFTKKPIYGFIIAGENTLNQYPVDFTVYVYNGVSLEDTIAVVGNTELVYNGDTYVTEADSIKLVIHKWSEINAVVKILEFYSTIIRTYEGDTIKSISVLEEREIRDGTTPIGNISSNEITVELQNIEVDGVIDPFFPGNSASDLNLLLKPGRKVEIEMGFLLATGFIEYIPMGTYWTGDFIIKENIPTISFTARDRMEQLRKLTYDDNEYDTYVSFYTLIRNMLISARNKIPQLTYVINAGLVLLDIPNAFIDRISYFEAIKTAVAACGGQAYMSKEDELIIESSEDAYYYTGGPDLFITRSQYFTKDQPSRYEEIINRIEIETKPLVRSDDTSTVYKSEEPIDLPASATLDPIELKYTELPVTSPSVNLSGTGCTPVLDSAEYYSWGCVLTISNSAGTPGTFTIEITGYTYDPIGSRVVSSQDSASIAANGKKVHKLPDNHLHQLYADVQTIADGLIASYADPRNDLNLEWIGNPALELGDIIVVPEYGSNQAVFKIYKLQTTFNGTLRQTISARRIETYIP